MFDPSTPPTDSGQMPVSRFRIRAPENMSCQILKKKRPLFKRVLSKQNHTWENFAFYQSSLRGEGQKFSPDFVFN